MLNNSLAILQTQQQTLAPQQQFALKLLQMSAAELLAETALAAEDNPFIEREDSHLESENEITETKLFEEQADSIDFPERFGESAAAPAEARPLERIYSLWPGSGNGAFDDASPAEKVAEKESLREYLLAELGGLKLNEKNVGLLPVSLKNLMTVAFSLRRSRKSQQATASLKMHPSKLGLTHCGACSLSIRPASAPLLQLKLLRLKQSEQAMKLLFPRLPLTCFAIC